MYGILREVLTGELTAPPDRKVGRLTRLPERAVRLHADERGMLSIVALVTMLFFLVLIATLTNVGRAINLKIDAQNAADAAAYTASVEMARGMNAVTATNHLMGELLSFVVVHRAIGGPELEDDTNLSDQGTELKLIHLETKYGLMAEYYAAKYGLMAGNAAAGQSTTMFEPFAYKPNDDKTLSADIITGATTRDGKIRLKFALQVCYGMKIAAAALIACRYIPYVGQALYGAGMALGAAAHAMEFLIYAEWKVLDLMQTVAKNAALLKFRDIMYTWMLPNAYSYLKFIEATSGMQAGRAAASVAELNGFRCSTMDIGMLLGVPVKPENYPGSAGYKEETQSTDDPGLNEGASPSAKYFGKSDKASAKDDKQQQADSGKSTGAEKEQGDNGVGDFPVPSFFQLKFWNPAPGTSSTEKRAVRKAPFANPELKDLSTSKWEYGEGGLYWHQVTMATFPWVCYDRKPIMIFSAWMIFSNTSGLFRYYTNGYCIERGQYMCTRQKKPALLYVLKGSNVTFKGAEMFTGWEDQAKVARQAKSFFRVRAVVQRPAEEPFSKAFFYKQSPEVGEFAYAAAMICNAGRFEAPSNAELKSSILDGLNPPYQAQIPYDTLNWENPKDSSNARRWAGYCKYSAAFWPLGYVDATLLDGVPRIKLNWQAKLVPAELSQTDVIMGRVLFPGPLTKPLGRAFPLPSDFSVSDIGNTTDLKKAVKEILENH